MELLMIEDEIQNARIADLLLQEGVERVRFYVQVIISSFNYSIIQLLLQNIDYW